MVELIEVEKSYKDTKAVDGISFAIQKGEIFGLIGANGAGKSTTISMIATLLKPDKGNILYDGESIVKNPKTFRAHLGYVPQDIALYHNLTGLDNLKFWGRAYKVPKEKLDNRIQEVSNMIGLSTDILSKRVGTYSGGFKRRINLGAALLHHPDILLLDEPTVGIDIAARNHILNSVKMLNKTGTTILYCGHYLEEMKQLCDTICIMENGKVKVVVNNKDKNNTWTDNSLEDLYFQGGNYGKV